MATDGRLTPREPSRARRRRWAAWLRPYAGDTAVAAALAAISLVALTSADEMSGVRDADFFAYALALMLTLPLAVRRRWPLGVFAIVLVGVLAYDSAGYPAVNVDFFGPVLGLYTVAAFCARRWSLLAAGVLGASLFALMTFTEPAASDGSMLTSVAIIVGTWLLGDSARQRREAGEVLAQQAEDLRQARAEMAVQVVTQERLRIARELHDVVAHHMSAVVVQSAVALDLFGSDPAASRRAIARVETMGRSALREMRGILGVLREGDAERGALAPTPGIEDIDSLCARMRESGLAVSLRLETGHERRDVPLAVGLAAYRLVQEGLTNVLKHAPTNVASVDVTLRGGALQVEVRDSGQRPAGAASTGGVGLVGMRERVTLLGGVFEAGPTGDGFRLHGSIPLEEVG